MSQATGLPRSLAGAPATTTPRLRSRWLRPLLMLAGSVLLVLAALGWWVRSGRWISIDDATIQAARLAVATDVSGIVDTVAVREGQAVRAGDVLFTLDPRPFRIALEGALAERAQSVLTIEAMKRDEQRMLHEIQVRAAQVQGDQATYGRLLPLLRGGAATREEADDARFKLAADQQDVEALRVQAQVQLARLGGRADIDPTKTPAWRSAQARVAEAQRELDHAVVHAPFDGIVTQVDQLQPGSYLAAATAAFALVSTDQVWAEGNPKETQLTWVRAGDPARVTVDTYPGRSFDGRLGSIAPATGAEFSLLPAQNTSGNWVKVTQRIPVRVLLVRRADDPPLRAGMSVTVSIDTGHVRHLRDLF